MEKTKLIVFYMQNENQNKFFQFLIIVKYHYHDFKFFIFFYILYDNNLSRIQRCIE